MDQSSSPNHLRSQGYRLTPQRLIILDILEEDGGHQTPQEIYERARQRLPGLTETTVYRTLDFLVEHGLALAAHVGGGKLLYENAHHNHHHLVCRTCGQGMEIDHSALQELYAHFKDTTGFEVDSSHIVFFGKCSHCQS